MTTTDRTISQLLFLCQHVIPRQQQQQPSDDQKLQLQFQSTLRAMLFRSHEQHAELLLKDKQLTDRDKLMRRAEMSKNRLHINIRSHQLQAACVGVDWFHHQSDADLTKLREHLHRSEKTGSGNAAAAADQDACTTKLIRDQVRIFLPSSSADSAPTYLTSPSLFDDAVARLLQAALVSGNASAASADSCGAALCSAFDDPNLAVRLLMQHDDRKGHSGGGVAGNASPDKLAAFALISLACTGSYSAVREAQTLLQQQQQQRQLAVEHSAAAGNGDRRLNSTTSSSASAGAVTAMSVADIAASIPALCGGLTLEMFAAESGSAAMLQLAFDIAEANARSNKRDNSKGSISSLSETRDDVLSFACRSGELSCVLLCLNSLYSEPTSEMTNANNDNEQQEQQQQQQQQHSQQHPQGAKQRLVMDHSRSVLPFTPLQVASEVGATEIVEALLSAGIVDATEKTDRLQQFRADQTASAAKLELSPAFFAAKNGHVDIIHRLQQQFKHNTNGHSTSAAGVGNNKANITSVVTPLHVACMTGQGDAIAVLLFGAAGRQKQDDAVAVAASDAAVLTIAQTVDARSGKTPLHIAAAFGSRGCIEQLFKIVARLPVDPRDRYGNTPLLDAVRVGATRTAAALISRGASCSAANQAGFSALHEAALRDNAAVLSMLLRSGAEMDMPAQSGRTALHIAVCGSDAALKSLLNFWVAAHKNAAMQRQRGSAVAAAAADNTKGAVAEVPIILTTPDAASGKSALHFAVLGQHLRSVKWLLRYGDGCNLDSVPDDTGVTPLQLAAQMNATGIVRFLVRHSAAQAQQQQQRRRAAGLPPLAAPSMMTPQQQHQQGTSNTGKSKQQQQQSRGTNIASITCTFPGSDVCEPIMQSVRSGDCSILRAVINNSSDVVTAEHLIGAIILAAELNLTSVIDTLVPFLHMGGALIEPSPPGPAAAAAAAATAVAAGAPVIATNKTISMGRASSVASNGVGFSPAPRRPLGAAGGAVTLSNSIPAAARAINFNNAALSLSTKRTLTDALEAAVRCRHIEAAERLLEYGASAEGTSLVPSRRATMTAAAGPAGATGIDETASTLTTALAPSLDATPLREAVVRNHEAMVRLLLERGRARIDSIHSVFTASGVVEDRVPFQLAVFKNLVGVAAALIQHGAAFDRPDHNDRRPLHIAAGNGSTELVRVLVDAGADVHRTDCEGRTPLHEAAFNGHTDVCRILVAAGASVERTDAQGHSMMQEAFRNGHIETTAALIWGCFSRFGPTAAPPSSSGAVPSSSRAASTTSLGSSINGLNSSASNAFAPEDRLMAAPRLLEAVLRGDEATASALLSGGDMSAPASSSSLDDSQAASDHAPDSQSHYSAARRASSASPEPSAAAAAGSMPRSYSSASTQLPMMYQQQQQQQQQRAAVSADITAAGGWTALHIASATGHDRIVKMLLSAGASVNRLDRNGRSALHEASRHGHAKCAVLLLIHGSFADAADMRGSTPLMEATGQGHVDVIISLIRVGKPNLNGWNFTFSPLHEAAARGHVRVVAAFIDSGVPADILDGSRRTPLCLAAMEGHAATVKFLVVRGKASPDGVAGGGSRSSLASAMSSMLGDFVDVGSYFGSAPADDKSAGSSKMDSSGAGGKARPPSQSPLQYASYFGHTDVVEYLLECGVHPDGRLPENSFVKTALYFASSRGHTGCVAALLKRKPSLNRVTETFATPLHAAALGGHLTVVELLVKAGCPLEATTTGNWSALHLAARAGHSIVVGYLIKCGAVAERVDAEGTTPLRDAARAGHLGVVEVLLQQVPAQKVVVDRRSADGRSCLHDAALNGHGPVVALLVQKGFAVVDRRDKDGFTPLFLAATGGSLEAVRSLLNGGGSFGVLSAQGLSPLHAAAAAGRTEVVEFFVTFNPDRNAINAPDSLGKTPMYFAAAGGHLPTVLALLERGAKVDTAAQSGATPLHAACAGGHQQVVEVLLHVMKSQAAAGTDGAATANPADQPTKNDGLTPLHIACQGGYVSVCHFLISIGCATARPDKYGRTPLFFAVANRHTAVFDMLLSLESKPLAINHPSCTGTTALHVAAATGNVQFVKRLLERGASTSVTDNSRATPLHEVTKLRLDSSTGKLRPGHQEVARLLIAAGASVDACDFSEATPLSLAEQTRVSRFGINVPMEQLSYQQQQQAYVDDEIVLLMRQQHSSSRENMEAMSARWAALASCCCDFKA